MITEQQAQERRKYLGSSDIAACFTDKEGKSLDPFKTLVDVVASKIYEFEPDTRESKPMKSGVRWEPYLIDWAADELGITPEKNQEKLRFIRNDILGSDGKPIFACNLDSFFFEVKEKIIIEAKKTRWWKEWGTPDTDEIPDRVNLQTHEQMLVTGAKITYISALIQGDEKLFRIERCEQIIDRIIERGTEVWNTYVIPKIMPPATEAGHIETFKRIVRVPEKFAEIDNGKVFQWELRRGVRLDAEKKEEEAFAELLALIGDAEGVHLDDNRTFTYLKQKGASVIDRKKLQSQYPDVYKDVTRDNYFRVARVKKG